MMASRLPLTRFRALPRFLRDTKKVRTQLAATPGVIGYALDAHPLAKTFLTVSAWTDERSLAKFNGAEPHRGAKVRSRKAMGRSRFVTWECKASELPIPWAEVRRRLDAPD